MWMSSYPTRLTSPGTRTPARRRPNMNPIATLSLKQMTALGSAVVYRTNVSAALIPSISVLPPSRIWMNSPRSRCFIMLRYQRRRSMAPKILAPSRCAMLV